MNSPDNRLTARGVILAGGALLLMVGLTQSMTIRAQAADVGGSSPPVAPTYLLFLWTAAIGVVPTAHAGRRHWGCTRADLLLAYCAAMISGAIAHQYAVGFLIPHTVSPYYFDAGWEAFHRWLPGWFGPSAPDVVRGFFLGTGGRVPWGAWLIPILAWSLLLGALFLVGHCGAVLFRQQWVEHERLTFPLAQIPLSVTTAGAARRPALYRRTGVWLGLAVPLVIGTVQSLHRYAPCIPDLPLRPMGEIDFSDLRGSPWAGMGILEFRLYIWMVAIVALLPAEISFSGWFFFWVTKLEDISAMALGAIDLPNVYCNDYPALYAQGACSALMLAALALWAARRPLARAFRAALRGDRAPDEFASPRFALLGLLIGLATLVGWLWVAGMRWWVAGLLVALLLGYFLIFARTRGEAGLSMGVILWPKMLDEVLITLLGTRGLLASDLTVLYGVRWLYFGPAVGGVLACQLESLKIAGDAGLPRPASGRLLLLVTLATVPLAIAWTLHTYYAEGFSMMPIGHRERSMVGSQVYWSYFNLKEALANPKGTDWGGIGAMGIGGGVAAILTALRSRFLWWPLHPIGYMAANSWGMHWNWLSFMVGWTVKVLLLRYGGLHAFRAWMPLFVGLVVGDMLSAGLWGAFATWVALSPD